MTHTMEPPRAPGGTTRTSMNTALGELSALLPGQVTRPGEPEWDRIRYGFNLAVDQQPVAVVTAVDEEDVVATVRWANRYGATVSAQPVGHGATRATDGVVVLRTRGLREIVVDPQRRVARVGAGAKWGEVLAATAPYGLTGLAGSSPDPTVAGFSLSGGLSWFGRAYGLAAHSIVGIDLVDPSGERRWVTAASNPDLFWALRGGGGDFGIAVALEIALHPAPHVYGGRLMWPIEMALAGAEHLREGHPAGTGRAHAVDAPAAVPASADGARTDARQVVRHHRSDLPRVGGRGRAAACAVPHDPGDVGRHDGHRAARASSAPSAQSRRTRCRQWSSRVC